MDENQDKALATDALEEFGKLNIGVERATAVANQLKPIIDSRGLAVRIGQGEHLKVEAWVTCGMFCGVSPHTEWTEEVRNPKTGELEGYKARVQVIRMATEAAIGAAECSCHFDEQQKRREDGTLFDRWIEHGRQNRHACMSMAQTRATSKALAQALRWIPVLAGYSGTPFEEMPPEAHGDREEERPARQPRGKAATDPQLKKLYAVSMARANELLDKALELKITPKIQTAKDAQKEIARLAKERVGCGGTVLMKEIDPLLAAIELIDHDAEGVLCYVGAVS